MVSSDNPGIEPNKAIEERLNHYFMIKQPSRKIHMNSFGGMLVWLFSMKSLGFKASLVSACLAYFLFFGNIKNNPSNPGYSDSCQIHTLVADTNLIVKDTCK
jgi:hypothetical protein